MTPARDVGTRGAHRQPRTPWLALALLAGCATSGSPAASGPLSDLDWLSGRWVLETTRDDGTREVVEESWTTPRGDQMLGTNHTVRGGRSVSFEFLRIEAAPEGINYIASPGGGEATVFALVRSGPTWVTFANPSHDYPTHIHYHREGDELATLIEGEGGARRATWLFVRTP